MHKFIDDLPQGELEEKNLDRFFIELWHVGIQPATKEQQRDGIDRVWTTPDERRFSVEYKADWKAAETGNAFIEVVSVDKDGKPGWAYTSLAQYLIYYIPPWKRVYICPMTMIKERLLDWVGRYPHKVIPNEGRNAENYNTVGVPVPLDVFESECKPLIRHIGEVTA